MRLDKFLNVINITKRRSISEDMCKSGVVSLNEIVAKGAKVVKVGDKITIKYLNSEVNYEVLEIPTLKNTPKNEQDKYIKKL